MDEKKTIFDYIGEIFATYGAIVLIFIVFDFALGSLAEGYSSFFVLGNKGLSLSTLVQLFVFAILLKMFEWLFLTPLIIKRMAMPLRFVFMFLCCLISIVVFSIFFGWFPLDNVPAWIGFGISFAVCTAFSILLTYVRTRAENRKMERALRKFKEE